MANIRKIKYFCPLLVKVNELSAKKWLYGISVTLIGIALWQCSTDKNRFVNRAYHNTTAHYNGYFNAREAIKEALKSFRYSYKENYEAILPVVLYPNEEESKAMLAVMDTSISKCATVIKRHSMPEKKTGSKQGEEWGRWIDNNWLMIGVAHFHKKEFDRANEIFKYIENTYPEDENYHWSRLWTAKTHIENEDFNAANRVLLSLQTEIDEQLTEKEKKKEDKENKSKKSGYSVKKVKPTKKSASNPFGTEEVQHSKFSKQFMLEKKITESHLYVKSKDYKKATKSLEETIELTKNRKTKARLYFILAQIQQETGQLLAAGMSYEKVLKYTPPYEMAFYAQINQVFVSTGGNTNSLRNKLLRLSKDDKNADYLDVIYFALAELEFKENNKEKGIEYLKKSASYSKNNDKKAKAYLRLADLFYGDKKYIPSQAYYDSTLSIIKEEHDRFREVTRKNKNLKELVTHLNTIEFQDSVRHLANNFSEKDLIKKIEKMIAQKQREDEEKQKQQSAPVMLVNNPGVVIPTSGGGAAFWAFDQNLRTQGYNDFKRTWGTRVNEDNWRRSDKTSTFAAFGDEEDAGVDSTGTKLEYTVDYYLKDIPLTEEQKWRSDSLLINAYFGAGTVYKQGLNDYPEAINAFNKMAQLFPDAELTAAAHFNLYLIYKEQKKEDLAEKHRKTILNFFPETEYAKILSDPNYLANKSKELQKAKTDYELLLDNFNQKNYLFVVENTHRFATEKDTINPFYCQSIYLRATSIGYLLPNKDSVSAYEQALDYVVAQCPSEKVAELSQNTLDIIRKNTTQQITQISGVNYKYDANAQHFFIYVHESSGGSANSAKIALSDFSTNSFSTQNLNVSSAIYSQENQLVVVKTFKSKKEAESFLVAFKADKDKLKPYNQNADNFFIISQPNYLLLYKEKDIDGYRVFYEKNYKK